MCAAITADRGFTWSDEETSLLLQLWGGNDAQSELTGNKRNFVVYGKISETMNEMGYFRTASQCREKIKRMKREYTLTKQHNESGVGNKKNMRFYEQFEKILLEKQKRNLKNTTLKPCSSKEMESEIDESDKKSTAARYDRKQRKTHVKSNERLVKELSEPSEKELDTPWTPDVLIVEDTPNPLLMDNHSIASTSSVNGSKIKKRCIAAHKYRKMTHRSASKVLKMSKLRLHNKHKDIRKLKEKTKRKIFSIETFLSDLQEKNFIDESSKHILELSGVTESMMEQLQKKRSIEEFPDELKTFVLTLYFYSVEAYDYVRKSLGYHLPHPVTLRKWYHCIDGSPGFLTTSLNACKQKVLEASISGKNVQCALIVDEMPIRDDIQFDGHRYIGYIDYGTDLNHDLLPAARGAYTFMLNCITDNWKVPIAYFFIDGLSPMARANIISLCLKKIYETGIEVISLTLDGIWMRKTVECLNGNVEVFNYMKPHFQHPLTRKPVQIIIDPSFLIKSIMYNLATCGSLIDGQGRVIKWEYIVALQKLQKHKGLLLPTKIRKRNIEWNREKIKLASRVFSASVADALSYLAHDANIPEFQNCDATIEFLKFFNTLFDIFYSKNCFSNDLKAPLSESNKNYVWQYLNFAERYIKSLRAASDGLLLIKTRKTGVLGFLTCIYSIKELYSNLIETKNLEYISMYKFSQDNLKMFFGAIRSRTGTNDDEPTAKLFSAAYKCLVCQDDVCSMSNIYCTESDRMEISKISYSVNYYNHSINKSCPFSLEITEYEDNGIDLTNFHKLEPIVGDIIVYVAGFVVKKVIKSIHCPTCIKALLHNKETCNITNSENGGGLIIPGRDVIQICRVAERIIRVFKFEKALRVPIIMEKIITHSMRDMLSTTFSFLNNHIMSQDVIENHKILLIKSVIFEFLKIRLNQIFSCYEYKLFEEYVSFETIELNLKKYWASVLKNETSF